MPKAEECCNYIQVNKQMHTKCSGSGSRW